MNRPSVCLSCLSANTEYIGRRGRGAVGTGVVEIDRGEAGREAWLGVERGEGAEREKEREKKWRETQT